MTVGPAPAKPAPVGPAPVGPAPVGRATWAGYGAAAWALVFAVRGAYWALGGTVGLDTVAGGIREAAAAGDPTVFVALWVSVGLEILVALLALALVRPWGRVLPSRLPLVGGRRFPGWLLLTLAWGAGTLLAGHGGSFTVLGLIAVAGGGASQELFWYTFLWGPWFLLGGVLFMAAAWSYLRRSADGRTAKAGSLLGATGGLALAAMPLLGVGSL